jgi:hypothetical protein
MVAKIRAQSSESIQVSGSNSIDSESMSQCQFAAHSTPIAAAGSSHTAGVMGGQRHGPRRSRKCTAPDTQKPQDSLLSSDMTLTAHQDEQGWRTRFQRRFLKQQQWQAERQRHKKGKETEESSFNIPSSTSHGQKLSNMGKSFASGSKLNAFQHGQKNRSQRTRTCKRCGLEFAPQSNSSGDCRWHTGRYVAMDEDGVIIEGTSATTQNFQRRAQHLMRLESRRKGSKKSNMVVFSAAGDLGVAREDGIAWKWSCCLSENLVGPGCSQGPHS